MPFPLQYLLQEEAEIHVIFNDQNTGCYESHAGISTIKLVQEEPSLSTATRPLWLSMSRRAIVTPRPAPPRLEAKKRSKIRSPSSAGMSKPLFCSRTCTPWAG